VSNVLLKGIQDPSAVELLEIMARIWHCELSVIEGEAQQSYEPGRPKTNIKGRPRHAKSVEIIANIRCGYGHRDIARRLNVPPSTVDNYAKRLESE
jgi:DNA-binding NarL/FixJ family response regulator